MNLHEDTNSFHLINLPGHHPKPISPAYKRTRSTNYPWGVRGQRSIPHMHIPSQSICHNCRNIGLEYDAHNSLRTPCLKWANRLLSNQRTKMHSKICEWFGHDYVFINNSVNELGIYPERCTRCGHERTRIDGRKPENPRRITRVLKIVAGVAALLVLGVFAYTRNM